MIEAGEKGPGSWMSKLPVRGIAYNFQLERADPLFLNPWLRPFSLAKSLWGIHRTHPFLNRVGVLRSRNIYTGKINPAQGKQRSAIGPKQRIPETRERGGTNGLGLLIIANQGTRNFDG